jgi:hypothetical protein
LFIFGKEALGNSLYVKKKFRDHFYRDQVLRDLARILITEIAKVSAPQNKEKAPTAGGSRNQKDTERVLTVLLALALALLAITAFALARAQQRIRLNEIGNGTHETVSGSAAYCALDEQASQIQKSERPG